MNEKRTELLIKFVTSLAELKRSGHVVSTEINRALIEVENELRK